MITFTIGGHEFKFKSKTLLCKPAQANELGLINKICGPIWRSLLCPMSKDLKEREREREGKKNYHYEPYFMLLDPN